jgi:hypothetical protein
MDRVPPQGWNWTLQASTKVATCDSSEAKPLKWIIQQENENCHVLTTYE